MGHLTHRDERNTLSDERRHEAQRMSAAANERSVERERHTAGYVPYTAENNAIRDRKRAANHNCDVLDAIINRQLGEQRRAASAGIADDLELSIVALRAREAAAKVEEKEAEGEFNKMIREAV